jgi:hypothetical protein
MYWRLAKLGDQYGFVMRVASSDNYGTVCAHDILRSAVNNGPAGECTP